MHHAGEVWRMGGNRGTSKRPSMFEVAKLAGVSHQTVSRVINDSPDVSAATRAKVQAAIKQLDYRPSNSARALASHRSRTIGLIAGGMKFYGPISAISAIEMMARKHGLFMSVMMVHEALCSQSDFEELCDQIADRSTASRGDVQVVVDGLLYILKQRLQKGETVQLGDLGHFQAVIGSKGTKLESDFNASLIKRPRIVFRPSVTLKSVTGLAKFEKIVPDAPAPGGGDSESPDEI